MSVITKRTKAKTGLKAARAAAKRPQLLVTGAKAAVPAGKAGLKASRPLFRRRARRGMAQLEKTSRTLGTALAVYGPRAAYELGLATPPKPKRTAPRVAAGIVIGASAMYFLEPESGRRHRDKVAELVS